MAGPSLALHRCEKFSRATAPTKDPVKSNMKNDRGEAFFMFHHDHFYKSPAYKRKMER